MKVIDPGHSFRLDIFSTRKLTAHAKIANDQPLIFMKREGPEYPGNVGHYPGTNLQECWRADISRIKYLQNQEPCTENIMVIEHLRACICELEQRAARRHNRIFPEIMPLAIEDIPTCDFCGHIYCNGECRR